MTLRRETREQVGLQPPRNRRHDVALKGVAIHYPGAATRIRDMDHARHQQLVRGWQSMHMSRGSNDIEYGSLICPCGIWMEARTEWDKPMVRVGSNGTAAANRDYTSVQLMLGNAETIRDDEVAWLGEAVAWLRGQGWGAAVVGHRDLSQTACPGDSIYNALPAIRAAADAWTTAPPPVPDDDLIGGLIPMSAHTIVFFRTGNTWNEGNLLAGTYQAYSSQPKLDARKAALRDAGVPFTVVKDPVDNPAAYGRRAGEV